jgi:probable rRNA maturation factor
VSVSLDIRTGSSPLDPRFPLARHELAAFLEAILDALGLSGAHVALTLLDDPGIAVLNAEFLGCQGPTNILSFPEAAADNPQALGALFLSVDTLARETFLYGQDPREHLARLLGHGVLHLYGHDHGPEMDALTDLAVRSVCPQMV